MALEEIFRTSRTLGAWLIPQPSSLSFLSYRDMTNLFGNLTTGAKNIGSSVLIFRVGPQILGSEQVGIQRKF
jgi:hypothetical protein